jgi:hypothetical protein
MYFKHNYYYSYPYVNVIKGSDIDKKGNHAYLAIGV